MTQLPLPMLHRLDGPDVVAHACIASIESYREAVRACWAHRRIKGATQRTVAEHIGCQPSHMSEYLSDEDKRDLPARFIKAFECYAGNSFISQWIAAQAHLTVLEEIQAERVA